MYVYNIYNMYDTYYIYYIFTLVEYKETYIETQQNMKFKYIINLH